MIENVYDYGLVLVADNGDKQFLTHGEYKRFTANRRRINKTYKANVFNRTNL